MSGADFGAFIPGLIVVVIAFWLLHYLYLRSSKERAFVRTGLRGQKGREGRIALHSAELRFRRKLS